MHWQQVVEEEDVTLFSISSCFVFMHAAALCMKAA
jgi:hypothetical protein